MSTTSKLDDFAKMQLKQRPTITELVLYEKQRKEEIESGKKPTV